MLIDIHVDGVVCAVPFNAIVLGLGHMRATGGGVSSLGTVADKMDLVQMMLDCAETMTSVLDDVTDMGKQWVFGLLRIVGCIIGLYGCFLALSIIEYCHCSWFLLALDFCSASKSFCCLYVAGQWEVGQMELHKDEFDILAVINFLSWGLKDLLEQKQITFNMNVDDLANQLLTSHCVIGDKQRVVQTLGEHYRILLCVSRGSF